MKQNIKWRGIPTTTTRKNEKTPKTINNRFKQLSLSLPRIDDKKRWAGYAGLTGVSRKIANLIPECGTYVEPFAGTAKVYQELLKQDPRKFNFAVLNDKAKFICDWLAKNFSNAYISRKDFTEIIDAWDFKNSFMLIDQPWNKGNYDQSFSCFDRENTKEYDDEILERCSKMVASFIITTRKENRRMLKSGFNNYLIQSEYVVSGRYPLVLITTNLELKGLQKARSDPFE